GSGECARLPQFSPPDQQLPRATAMDAARSQPESHHGRGPPTTQGRALPHVPGRGWLPSGAGASSMSSSFSSWLRQAHPSLRRLLKWLPVPPYEGVKWARLGPLEELETRQLFSVDVWLLQRLQPVGGVNQYNVSAALFQPVSAALLPQLDLRSGSLAA